MAALLLGALLSWLLWPSRDRQPSLSPETAAPSQPYGPGSGGPPVGVEAPALPPPPIPAVAEALLAISGRVISAWTGAPVAGAELTFAAPEGATSTRSGADGRFRFVPQRVGAYQLAAVLAEGHVPFGPDWGQSPIKLQVPTPRGAPDLVITLEPETQVSGRVQTEDGRRLAGATVVLRVFGSTPGLASSERTWTTDERGEFQGGVPQDGVLVARHRGFLAAAIGLRREHVARQSVTITLKRAEEEDSETRISGRVQDAAGAPVPGASVALGPKRWRAQLGWALLPSPVSSDAEGRFTFSGVPDNVGWVQARSGELLSERTAVQPGQEGVLLTVRPGGTLAGRVTYADGRPASAFALRLQPLRAGQPSQTLSVIEADGRWEVPGLSSGAYQLQALAPGAGPSDSVRVEIPPSPGARVERDLRLRAGHRLSGTVRDAKTRAPVPNAEVAVEGSPGEDSFLVRADVFTGADGRFELEGLPDALATVTASAEGYNRRLLTIGRGRSQVEVLLRPVESGQSPATDLVGIGAVVNRGDDGLVLGTVVPAGGAALAGLHAGDVVTRIDGVAVADLDFVDAIQRLRGEEGSMVRLDVRRADGTRTTIEVLRRPVTF
jgi:hypothetical protein